MYRYCWRQTRTFAGATDSDGLIGGRLGAVRVYLHSPERFTRLVVLAAYPPPETVSRFTSSMKTYFVVGGRESYVQSGEFHRSLQSIRPRVGHLAQHIVSDADHYFLLAKREDTIRVLKNWMSDKESRPSER